MDYTIAVELARRNLDILIQATAEKIKASVIEPYSHFDQQSLTQLVMQGLNQYFHYLETGDLEQWKAFCVSIIDLRINQISSYGDIIELDRLMVSALKEFFQSQLLPQGQIAGQDAAKYVRSLENRLNGLHSVAITTGTATAMRLKQAQRNEHK